MPFARRILHDSSPWLTAPLLLLFAAASCRPGDSPGGTSGAGGTKGSGGTAGGGGTGGAAETRASGGSNGTGGGAGGSKETGGAGGGASGRGGSNASGGSNAAGGSGLGGGPSGSGGSSARGGSSASGGSGGSGGSNAGGGPAAGGATGSGGISGRGGSGGGGGSGGAGGSGTLADAAVNTADTAPPPPSRGPAPATPGHAFPFPQNRENSRCIYPNLYRNEDVQAAYTQWKNDTVTSDGAKGFRRVKRPNEPGLEKDSTVSEGIAYGMLLAVYMDDQSLFDDLWQYEQQFLDSKTGLMNWYIKADGSGLGSNPSGAGPASDADEDMGFALVLADKQWGGQGKLKGKYIDLAKTQIGSVWNNEVYNYQYLKPWPATNLPALNLSYFAPAFYKVFAKVDTANASNWQKLTDTMYTALSAALNSSSGNTDNGLVPAWCDTSGKPNAGAFGATGGASPTNYQYDSCRTPFRIGLDYCWTGDTRAQAYVAKTSKFFSGVGASNIVDGYDLNGTPHAQYQTGSNAQEQSSAFVGPAGIGAMSSSTYQDFLNQTYGILTAGKALVGGTYYDESWMVMSLLMMTANYLDYTSL